jgi:microcystin-dependent protein
MTHPSVTRADYHGSFVNLAARYAAVAAQGGQLVTDADLARQILSMWKVDGGSHDTLGAHGAAGSSSSSSSRAWQHTAPLPASTAAATAAAAAADTSASTPFASSSQALLAKPEPAAAAAAAAVCATAGATATVDVECCWLGSFLFKGNPSPVSMVTFSPAVLSGRHYAPQAVASTKGVRVLQRVGVMDRAVVCLPAAVEGFGPWDALPSSLK